jgi:hypothetical protein
MIPPQTGTPEIQTTAGTKVDVYAVCEVLINAHTQSSTTEPG